MSLVSVLDILITLSAFAAAVFWWMASSHEIRRISRFEELDAADINRIVVAINRNQVLNRRGALAASASALLTAMRFALSALTR